MREAPDRNHFYGDAVVYDILHAAGTAAEARRLVGLSITEYGAERPTRDVWTAARGRCHVEQTAHYRPPEPSDRKETVRSRIRVRTPAGCERRECVFTLRTYTGDELLALIDRSPLRLERVLDVEWRTCDLPAADYCHLLLRPR